MITKKINGYTIEIATISNSGCSLFVTLEEEGGKLHYFTLTKVDGEWSIRNPGTVAPFIQIMEEEIVKDL